MSNIRKHTNPSVVAPKYNLGMPSGYEPLSGKAPLLVVGAHSFLRQRFPAFILQQWDLHLMFIPNRDQFCVALVAFKRNSNCVAPVFVSANGETIEAAISEAVLGMHAQLSERPETELKEHPKRLVWLTQWVCRSPKLSLKDALKLERDSK